MCDVSPHLARHFENEFERDRDAEREAGDASDQAGGIFVFAKDVLEQVGGAVGDFRMLADIAGSGYGDAEADDADNMIERSEMLAGDSEGVEGGNAGGLAASLHVELGADTADEFRRAAFCGKHAA